MIQMTRDDLVEAIVKEGMALKRPPEKLIELAERVADRFRLGTDPLVEPDHRVRWRPEWYVHDLDDIKMYDLLHEQDYRYPNNKRKAKKKGGKVIKRDPAKITHIVVHQTAAEFGVSRHAVKAANGDRELALARRALDVACHSMAFRGGFFVRAHPLVDHVNHGNGYNAYSLGLEIDGRYSGVEDDPDTVAREDLKSTWGGKPTVLTAETTKAACAAIADMVERGRAQGMPLTHIVAHRQSSPTRRSDPGETIWREVVIEFAEKELGLQVSLDETLKSTSKKSKGSGLPIPRQWDPRSTARY